MTRIRNKHYLNLSDFKEVSPGKYTVVRNGEEYRIEGGRKLGGKKSDWFLEGGSFNKAIHCKSIVDALQLLENM